MGNSIILSLRKQSENEIICMYSYKSIKRNDFTKMCICDKFDNKTTNFNQIVTLILKDNLRDSTSY